jgi:hypothetical protein
MNIDFLPKIKTLAVLPDTFTTDEIKNETMIFSGDWDFTYRNGGPITRRIMSTLRQQQPFMDAYVLANQRRFNLVVDTRVNQVMKDWYPSIPGWHCDDVPRLDKYSQPDFSLRDPTVQHFCVLISDSQPDPFNGSGVSGTEYLIEPTTLAVDPTAVWHSVDILLNDMLAEGVLGATPTSFAKDKHIIQFDQNTLHRTSPARTPGWRLFFRCSLTYRKPANEIRKQVQVYIPPDKVGW